VPQENSKLRVVVVKTFVKLDPELAVWHVRVESMGAVWTESYGSEDAKDAFVTGLTAAAQMLGAPAPEVTQETLEIEELRKR